MTLLSLRRRAVALELFIRQLPVSNFDCFGVLGADDAVGQDLVHRANHDGVEVEVDLPVRVRVFPPDVFFAVETVIQFVCESGGVLLAPEEHPAHDEVSPVLEAGGGVPGLLLSGVMRFHGSKFHSVV